MGHSCYNTAPKLTMTQNVSEPESGRETRRASRFQLCVLRVPGRPQEPGEVIPEEVLQFIADQMRENPDDLLPFAAREETRRKRQGASGRIYGYRMFMESIGKFAHRMES